MVGEIVIYRTSDNSGGGWWGMFNMVSGVDINMGEMFQNNTPYRMTEAGTVTVGFPEGQSIDVAVGDFISYNGTAWVKYDFTNTPDKTYDQINAIVYKPTDGDVYYVLNGIAAGTTLFDGYKNDDLTANSWTRYNESTKTWKPVPASEYMADDFTLKPISTLTDATGKSIVSLQAALTALSTTTTKISTNLVEW
jgi:hypothetical protein